MTVHQRRPRVPAAALGLAALAFLTAGCGGSGGGENESNGSATGASAGGGPSADQQLKLAKCMREHGVDMPDPKAGEDAGGITLGGGGMSAKKIEEAVKACRTVAGIPEPKPVSQAEKDKQLRFARCMREHGVNMPDPKFDGGATAALPLPSTAAKKQEFDKANKACGSQIGSTGR
ncbi:MULTISPECIES: hypothetical protein [Actinomadura]|uniref:Secreted protein n=1 Tax=Actinomadura yumaensis TaxID=111807 RepID=A0ABW2CKB3_9ACTN|nr:hypothetical protein [Actinomadura sp. J1-007]MWK36913.1 hypothetical protein [Actinomadura sp. J1-007]